MNEKKTSKYDTILLGSLFGFILPLIVFAIIYTIWFYKLGKSVSFNQVTELGLWAKFLSLSVIPNLILFFVFTCECRNWVRATKGLIFSTIIIALFIFLLYQ